MVVIPQWTFHIVSTHLLKTYLYIRFHDQFCCLVHAKLHRHSLLKEAATANDLDGHKSPIYSIM